MTDKEPKYGFVTVGVGIATEPREIPIEDYVHSVFKDDRHVHVAKLINEEGYTVTVENLPSSGRHGQNSMWLSEDSLTALVATVFLYYQVKQIDINSLLKKSIDDDHIKYSFSDNLKPIEKAGEQ